MIEYTFNPKLQQSQAWNGDEMIGVCEYQVRNSTWYITHTGVDPEWGGQGIARKLVLMVDEEAKKQGVEVVPICSYAVKVLG